MKIQIIVSSNHTYIPLLGVLLQSLKIQGKHIDGYDVTILYSKLSDFLKKQLEETVLGSKIQLHFYDMNPLITDVSFYVENREDITKEAYYRLFAPWILKEENYAIYLDCDMVLCADPAMLLDQINEQHAVCAVRDYVGIGIYYSGQKDRKEYFDQILHFSPMEDYFIDGMMVMNLKWFRKHYSVEKMVELIQSRQWMFHDQDILNIICKNQVGYLDARWNYLGKRSYYAYLPEEYDKQVREASYQPYIYHYAGAKDKVWQRMSFEAMEYFWPVAEKTVFYEKLVQKYADFAAQNNVRETLEDKRKKETVYIAFATDSDYLPITAVAIYSVILHSDVDRKYVIRVMQRGLLEKQIQSLLEIANYSDINCEHVSLEMIDMETFVRGQGVPVSKRFPDSSYDRYYIPQIFPETKKVLYLDSDLVAVADVARLYDFDLEGKTIGACVSCFTRFMNGYVRKWLKRAPEKYFNSGVLLIDTKAFEREEIRKKCFEILIKKPNLLCWDQDALNIVCENQVLFLPDEWNYQWSLNLDTVNSIADMPLFWQKNRMIKAYKKRKIIHYASDYKPWNGTYHPLENEFWKVVAMLPVRNQIYEDLEDLKNHKKSVLIKKSGLSDIERHMMLTYCGRGLWIRKKIFVHLQKLFQRGE